MSEINYISIGERIRSIRKQKKWTQEELAEVSGVEPSNISHIERAATKVSLPTLLRIANALEVTLDELVFASLVKSRNVSVQMIDELLQDCTPQELQAIAEIVAHARQVLRQFTATPTE
jgi:transcriptional regulator with XRE-family HTH domain